MRIVFGEIRDVTETTAIVDNRFQVTLAWAEAKLLGDFLQANVKAFEELNGPLKLPKIPAKIIVPESVSRNLNRFLILGCGFPHPRGGLVHVLARFLLAPLQVYSLSHHASLIPAWLCLLCMAFWARSIQK